MSFYDKSDNDVEISSVDRFSDKEWFRSTIFIAIFNDLSQIYVHVSRRVRGKARSKTMYVEEQFPFGGN